TNGSRELKSLPSLRSVHRMHRRVNLHRWTEQRKIANRHRHHIQYHAIEVEENFSPERDVTAVITKERRLNPGFGRGVKQFRDDLVSLNKLRRNGRIKLCTQLATTLSFLRQLGIQRIIKLARQHLFFLGFIHSLPFHIVTQSFFSSLSTTARQRRGSAKLSLNTLT